MDNLLVYSLERVKNNLKKFRAIQILNFVIFLSGIIENSKLWNSVRKLIFRFRSRRWWRLPVPRVAFGCELGSAVVAADDADAAESVAQLVRFKFRFKEIGRSSPQSPGAEQMSRPQSSSAARRHLPHRASPGG